MKLFGPRNLVRHAESIQGIPTATQAFLVPSFLSLWKHRGGGAPILSPSPKKEKTKRSGIAAAATGGLHQEAADCGEADVILEDIRSASVTIKRLQTQPNTATRHAVANLSFRR
jgi:hypothetical protein